MIILVEFASLIGGVALVGIIVLWLILAIFGGTLVDQAVTISNFVVSILFLIGALIEIIKVYKEDKKVLVIIECLALIGFAIYGFIVPYNNMIFHYSYHPLASAIQTTWIPALIINVINMYILEDEFASTIGVSFAVMFIGFFIGQLLTIGLWLFTGVDNTRELYNKVTYYENRNYEEGKVSSIDAMNQALEEFKNTLDDKSGDSVSHGIIGTKVFKEDYLEKYGFELVKGVRLLNSNIRYKVRSLRTSEVETFYFDSEKNQFVKYTQEEIISLEYKVAENLKTKFEQYAIIFVKNKMESYMAEQYLEEHEIDFDRKFIAQIENLYAPDEKTIIVYFKRRDREDVFTIEINKNNYSIINSNYELNEKLYEEK